MVQPCLKYEGSMTPFKRYLSEASIIIIISYLQLKEPEPLFSLRICMCTCVISVDHPHSILLYRNLSLGPQSMYTEHSLAFSLYARALSQSRGLDATDQYSLESVLATLSGSEVPGVLLNGR